MAHGFTNDATTVAEDYLNGRGGSPSEFRFNLADGQRLGQAFYNALSGDDQERLRMRVENPFYRTGSQPIYQAIEFLLDQED